jgi:hypothetical protein
VAAAAAILSAQAFCRVRGVRRAHAGETMTHLAVFFPSPCILSGRKIASCTGQARPAIAQRLAVYQNQLGGPLVQVGRMSGRFSRPRRRCRSGDRRLQTRE